MNSTNRIAATLYSLGTCFVSGIQVKIPCIKEMIMMMIIIIIIIIIIMTVHSNSPVLITICVNSNR